VTSNELLRFQLSKGQWKEIRKTVDLPDETQSNIERVIGAFQFFQHASNERLRPNDIRKKLVGIANASRTLLTGLSDIDASTFSALVEHGFRQDSGSVIAVDSRKIFSDKITGEKQRLAHATARGGATPRRDALNILDELYGRVERMGNWASHAAKSLPSGKPGRYEKADNNQWFVRQLDSILFRFTGSLVNNSGKGPTHYVKECFKVADLNIGERAIEKAITRHVKTRRTITPKMAT
jgi:hypothetical protein